MVLRSKVEKISSKNHMPLREKGNLTRAPVVESHRSKKKRKGGAGERAGIFEYERMPPLQEYLEPR